MTVKTVSREEEIRELASLLSDYWMDRDMERPSEDPGYIGRGMAEEILGDKFFVEVGEDGVSGSISLVFRDGGVAELMDFYVIDEKKDSEIGEELLEKALQYCRRNGFRKVHAKVFPQTEEFYLDRGFEREGLLKDHFREGEDLAVVARFLDRDDPAV